MSLYPLTITAGICCIPAVDFKVGPHGRKRAAVVGFVIVPVRDNRWEDRMKTKKPFQRLMVTFAGLFLCSTAYADTCTGYDVLVTTAADTRDLGNGMTLTTFQAESILTSEDSIYHLATGQCAGTALVTPDGKVHTQGHCARRDKDGDTQSISFSQSPGADKGMWKSTGGTGKYAGKTDAGWFQDVRSDGKMAVSKWGGNCK